jgi:diguanylate cyclase (GGDEF)-like protein
LQGAKRIRKQLARETFGDDKKKIPITISMGVATYPEHGEDPETLVSKADAALYQAKKAGRDRVIRARGTIRKRKKKIRMKK